MNTTKININFKSKMKKSNNSENLKNEDEVVVYKPDQEIYTNQWVEANRWFIPMKEINEDSNVAYIGYCEETQCLVVQYKVMKYDVQGYELGLRPEPFGYWYHGVHKLVFNNLLETDMKKSDFINKYIKENYMYHREAIGVDLVLMQDEYERVA